MSISMFKRLATSVIVMAIAFSPWGARAIGERVAVTIDATKQGAIKGDGSGKISATAFSFESASPRDAASGQASGKVQNLPVKITKAVDGASPQLFQALATNETLKTVTIELYATNSAGQEAVTQTIRLTNASVANLRQYSGESWGNAGLQEDVSFSYQSIEFVGQAAPTPERRPAPTRVRTEPRTLEPADRPAPTRVPRPR